MWKRVIIAGTSFTGSTSLAEAVAERLEWRLIVAGKCFRDRFPEAGPLLVGVSLEEQLKFDREIVAIVESSSESVFDGRYLGWLCREHQDSLRVLVEAEHTVRVARCAERHGFDKTAAEVRIAQRDVAERTEFRRSHGDSNYLAEDLFHLVVKSSDSKDVADSVNLVLEMLV